MDETKQPDYTLHVVHGVDDETKRPCIVFIARTTKVFVSFQYDILLDASVEDRTVTITIKGLHAPELLMPGSGPAQGRVTLSDLCGHYALKIIKQDKTDRTYDIDIGEKDITVLRTPKESFVTLSTEPVEPS